MKTIADTEPLHTLDSGEAVRKDQPPDPPLNSLLGRTSSIPTASQA